MLRRIKATAFSNKVLAEARAHLLQQFLLGFETAVDVLGVPDFVKELRLFFNAVLVLPFDSN